MVTRQPFCMEPMPQIASWSSHLRQMAGRPLLHCPAFPRIARRFEAWWTGQPLDRPILIASANKEVARPINRRLNLLQEPDAWFDAKQRDMEQTHRVGDTLPGIRVDFGAAMLGGLLGGKTDVGADTMWTHPFINDDWSNVSSWRLHEEHPWWRMLHDLTQRVAQDAAGHYLVGAPDLGGATDTILNLRGPDNLCMDALEQPQRIIDAISAIHPIWQRVFSQMYEITTAHGAGLIHWLQLWSSQPYVTIACDFNYMIGPDVFQQVCVEDIDRMARQVGRAVFHLDGPGAARHIDALLELESLDAIQFTPGEGTPSALAWVEMFGKILHHGKSVLVMCPVDEVVELGRVLGAKGVGILTGGTGGTVEQIDSMYGQWCDLFPEEV